MAFRPDIQGLRAVAVLAVLGYHAGITGFGGGYLGVDVFFVISGFLIGGQLVRSLEATGRIDLWSFYARRARRILPASLAVIAATVVAAVLVVPPVRLPGIATDAVWSALSAGNLRFAMVGTDYLAGTSTSPLQHYWSLGVEEQFYIAVPLLLIGLFALVRHRRRLLPVAVAVLVATSFAVCLVSGDGSPWTYFGLAARAWELGAGILAAMLAARFADAGAGPVRALAGAGAGLLVVSAVAGSLPGFSHPGTGTVVPVVATAALLVAGASGYGARSLIVRALSVRPMRAVGTISFSLYLVHWPLLALATEQAPGDEPVPVALRVLLAVVSFPVAWLLWRFVERPFLTGRIAAAPARRSVAAAAAAVGLVAGSLLVATPVLAAAPLTSDRTAVDDVRPLPVGTPYVPSNVRPSLMDASADTGELYRRGCQQDKTTADLRVCTFGGSGDPSAPQVVLFGDSHAGRWFPALEAAFAGQDVQLVTLTKSGCRSLETEKMWAGAQNRSCAEWRASALEWITAQRPALIVLANHIGRSDRSAPSVEAQWRDATVSTIARFPAESPVAVLAETPEFEVSPPTCLSVNLEDAGACSEPRSVAVDAPVIAGVRAGAAAAGATFVDFTDWFCGQDSCPALIGRTVVYTDRHHVSATYSAQLGPAIRDALTGLVRLSDPA